MNASATFKDQTSHLPFAEKKKLPPHVKKKKIIVISGPTAVGKTDLSIKIARAIGGEIISADSVQIYNGMDIGTAKVSKEQQKEIPHHLIDICDLKRSFNVVDFYNEAMNAVRDITVRDRVPIIVGGSGFYIHALLYGPPSGPPSVPEIRNRLEEEVNRKGPDHLYQRLRELDPDYALTITQNDRQKIIRALEIISLSNQKVSLFEQEKHTEIEKYDFRCWFMYMPKELLYPRIEKRCEKMLDNGFIEEVRSLIPRGLEDNLSASQAIGYRQALRYLHSEQSENDKKQFIEAFKQASRRYAKRQFTWFRKEPLFRWLNIDEVKEEMAAEMMIQDIELSF